MQRDPELGERVIHRAQGAFGELLVVDSGPRRHLRFGGVEGVDQTVVVRRRPSLLPTVYLQVATMGAALAAEMSRVLLVGLGGGAYAKFLRSHYPAAAVDVVEVDPIMVQIARDYFGLRESSKLRVFVEDAAEFVADAAHEMDPAWRYDLILLDAYHGQKIPPALGRQAFFREVCALRRPGGVVVANIGLPERWAEDRVLRRFAQANPSGCVEFAVPDEDNRIAIATETRWGLSRLRTRLKSIDDAGGLPFEMLPFTKERRVWP